MKTTKIAFAALLSFSSLHLFAQQTEKTTFDVRAGINFQNVTGEDASGNKPDNKLKTGFHVGVDAEIPIAPEFYFAPGLLFSTKGAKGINSQSLNFNYLELPLNFLYKGTLGTGKLRLGLGPYIALGLGGKYKSSTSEVDVKFKSKADANSSAVFYKPIDAGANLLAGYEFSNNFFAQLNAQLGLVNLNAYDNNAKWKNTGFGVSLGYRF
jgi:hypothetical protein